MSALGIGLALAGVSAAASSSAHALLKSGNDKFAVQACSSLLALILALPVIFVVGLPERIILPWLFAGWVLHSAYYIVLIWSYSTSDFSVAYPIARGIVPVSTAILGIIFLGDDIGPLGLAGIGVISGGIILLSFNQSISRAGLLAAGIAGLLNKASTIVDAKGMRVADSAMNFLVWFYILDGLFMPLIFAVRAKGKVFHIARTNARNGFASGFMALFAFFPTLIAYRIAPVGAVSAIRATSVIFSMFMGGHLLKERLDGRRIAGALFITAGALAIIISAAFK
jgi:drug/metabolite transporter (DMT)-like permease